MPVFLCRWPNSDFSIVSARDKEHAIELLDEFGNAEGCPVRRIDNCVVNFKLTDVGEIVLEEDPTSFNEPTDNSIMQFCYPTLDAEYDRIFEEHTKEPDEARLVPELAARIRAAVDLERTRVKEGEKRQPQTERGKEFAEQFGGAASVLDGHMREAATRILKKFDPPEGSEH